MMWKNLSNERNIKDGKFNRTRYPVEFIFAKDAENTNCK